MSVKGHKFGPQSPEHRAKIGAAVSAARRVENPTYLAVHKYVYFDRGKASNYPCAHCCRRATTWAFQHDTPPEFVRVDEERRYSIRVEDYVALCASCHRRYDSPRAAA